MEIRHLRYFVAAAEAGHFTRAAEAVHVSQPTLSHQIRQLEEELGTPLFDRLGRSVRLTVAGEVFLDHARRILREAEAARVAVREIEGLEAGTLTVGVVQTVHTYLIPRIVTAFVSEYPKVGVQVRELAAGEIERGLVDGAIDLGIGFIPTGLAEVESEPLFEEDLVFIAAARHRLARRESLRVEELHDEPLVLLSREFCTRRLIDSCLSDVGATPRILVEMNAIEGILETVRAGEAATVLPELALADDRHGGVRAVPLVEPTPRRTVGLLWRRDAYRTAAARAFARKAETIASHA